MRAGVLALITLAGCGRVGFDVEPDGAVVSEGLVAWYRMNNLGSSEPQIRVAPDASGRGHDGQCEIVSGFTPICPALTPGRLDGAYRFNGSALILVSSAPDLVTTAGFTIAAWIQIDAQQPALRACVATKGLGETTLNSWALCVEPSRQLFFYSVAGTAGDELRSSTTVSIQAWHHVAIRWNGTAKDAFLDGDKVASSNAAVSYDTQSIRIGGDLDNGDIAAGFPGEIEDLRIYNRALASYEIAALAR